MADIFIKLVNMSIAAGWLILAVIILRLVLYKAPKWMNCILWGIVAFRLVCPVSFESTFSLVPSAETIDSDMIRDVSKRSDVSREEAQSGKFSVNMPNQQKLETAEETGSDALTAGDSNVPVKADYHESAAEADLSGTVAGLGSMYILIYAAGITWMIGISCLLGYALISYVRLHKSVSEAVCLRDNIWIGDQVKSPFILGIIRPKIYLSSSTQESEMAYILAHEQAHIKRKDHWWKLLGYLLLTVYCFHPLSWAAYILLCRDLELACDENVIRGLNDDEKKLYLYTLINCSRPRRMVLACPPAFGEVGVKRRVTSVLEYKKPAIWMVMISVLTCCLAAICFLTTSPRQYVEGTAAGDVMNVQKDQIVSDQKKKEAEKIGSHYYDEENMRQEKSGTKKKIKNVLPEDMFPMELLFASGASSSGTTLTLKQDGSFEGQHFDHENMAGEDYPNGMCYICDFSGRFEKIRQIDEYTYSMLLSEIVTEKEEGEEWIEDGVRYIASKPYGLEDGRKFLFYMPGSLIEELSEDCLSSLPGSMSNKKDDTDSQMLSCCVLYNKRTRRGFFQYN